VGEHKAFIALASEDGERYVIRSTGSATYVHGAVEDVAGPITATATAPGEAFFPMAERSDAFVPMAERSDAFVPMAERSDAFVPMAERSDAFVPMAERA
jgi:hypothetical protein